MIEVRIGARPMNLATIRTMRSRWLEAARAVTPPVVWQALYRRLVIRSIADADRYRPHFSPWLAPSFRSLYGQIAPYTLVSPDRCWTLWQGLAQAVQVPGDVMEVGVFQGGTARLLHLGIATTRKHLYLFDSFEGMHRVQEQDRHRKGDFSDTSIEAVQAVVGGGHAVHYRKGWIPQSFSGEEDRTFCFAHIDLDLYQSILDALGYLYPRLSRGGIVVFDDYGMASCPGARKAVDAFFADKPERPLALMTGQAIVHKL